jgi:hypothetical protein
VRTPADDAWLAAITGLDVQGDQRLDEHGWWTLSSTRPALLLLQSQAPDGPGTLPSGLNDRRSALAFPNGYIEFIALDAVAPRGPLSDIGWQACGIEVQIVNGRLRVQSTWSVAGLPAGRAGWYFGPFYHLVDTTGEEVLVFGQHGAGAKTWRIGDVYVDVTQIDLPADLPPGAYRLDYGLWDPNRDVRARFDVAGQSLDALTTPLTVKE